MYLYFEQLNAGSLYEKIQKEPTSVLFPAIFLLIWASSLVWAHIKDKVTRDLAEVEPLLDNEPLAQHYYQIIVSDDGYDYILIPLLINNHGSNNRAYCLHRPHNKCRDDVRRCVAPGRDGGLN